MGALDLRGIIPAIVTPMNAGAEVDDAALGRYVNWLVEQGPIALAVNVDTGEGPPLLGITAEERAPLKPALKRAGLLEAS